MHEDKHQSFLQADIVVFVGCIHTWLKVTKLTSFQYLCDISRKKGGMKLIFCMQINIKLSYKLILSILMGLTCHAQSIQSTQSLLWVWPDILKVPRQVSNTFVISQE